MKLSDIKPEKAVITFAKIGIPYTLNPFTLDDEAWIESEWPNEAERIKIFSEIQTKNLMRILWRLLDLESKRHVMSIKIADMDEDGNEFELKDLSGPEKLIYLVAGFNEVAELFQAMLKVRGMSIPVLKEIEKLQLEKQAIADKGKKKQSPHTK